MAHKRLVEEIEHFEVESRCSGQASIERQYLLNDHLTFACKKGRMRNYFDGTVSDGISILCMVGFNIQQARRGHSMKVQLNTTEIIGLPKKISASSLEFEDNIPATISLQDLRREECL